MGKKKVYLLVAVLFVSLAISTVPRTFSQPEDVKVTNYSYYFNPDGFLDVVGTVQNIGQNTIDSVLIQGTILDPTGVDVSDSGTRAWVAYLAPQQQAPFIIEFQLSNGDPWTQDEIGSIQLNIVEANATSSYQYPDLTITSSTPSIGTTGDYNGAYSVAGEIKNTGTQTATNLTVVAAFYNSTGSVVAVGYTDYLTPADLAPSTLIPFQVYALDLNQSEVPTSLKITSYSLLVQTEYPILQGVAPVETPYQEDGSSPAASSGSPTSSQSASNPVSNNSANPLSTTVIAAIAVIAIIVVIGAIVVIRKRKPQNTTAEVVVPRKATAKRER